jgi:hypothetical protein
MVGFSWNTKEWNFGYVQENSKLEFNFQYYSKEHTIKEITTSCGCTATNMRNKKIFTAILDTKKVINGKEKLLAVTIDVITSDGLTHKLHLKAIVTKNE